MHTTNIYPDTDTLTESGHTRFSYYYYVKFQRAFFVKCTLQNHDRLCTQQSRISIWHACMHVLSFVLTVKFRILETGFKILWKRHDWHEMSHLRRQSRPDHDSKGPCLPPDPSALFCASPCGQILQFVQLLMNVNFFNQGRDQQI